MHSALLLRRSRLTVARFLSAAAQPREAQRLLPSHMPIRAFSSSSDSYRLSSFAEPEPTLFFHKSASEAIEKEDPDAFLRSDIRTMGSLLGKVMEESTLHQVEGMRALAKKWRTDKTPEALQALALYAANLNNQDLQRVSRAFTHFLALANAAEQHHRIRRLGTTTAFSGLYNKPDSCGGVLPALLKEHDPEEIFQALTNQTTELVLTAHPTEVNRRTILSKHRRIQDILTQADQLREQGSVSGYEQAALDDALLREISSLWLSDEVSRFKPTPEDEAERGTLVVETVLWDTVPLFLRKLNATCIQHLAQPLPLDSQVVKFASWMGGDRDGNPNVKPDTTRRVCKRNRAKAARLFAADLESLYSELSLTVASEEILSKVEDPREPYRSYLRPMIDKLKKTQAWAESDQLAAPSDVYLSKDEFMDELLVLHRSLCDTGNAVTADGKLTDIIRKVTAFGLTLIPLDIRQESGRHEEAIDSITRFLGLGSYSDWDEDTKISWLTQQISSKRPLLRKGIWKEHPKFFSETCCDTLEIHEMIAEQPEGSLGAYVISQATTASDVLAVLLLQLDAGVKKPLRVAPLFETLDDLNGATDTMRKLFSLPVYMGIIQGKQEVMIGYSDSAKDAGRLSAIFAQYQTQESIRKLADEFNIDMTFFHGKGGTVGRGGNPQTFHAIMSHAPETINGKFRVTEQGEMIHQNFGHYQRAERTLDIYTAAVLAERLKKRPAPKPEWRALMQEMSDISCAAYRSIVRGDERFVPYFRAATPESEFASLKIGSRPSKRKASGGVESLRAIPWNFAWTQTRFNLPTWLGVGHAFDHCLKDETKAPILKDMYQGWDSFRTMVDLVEMILSKSEPAVAKHYEDVLCSDPKAKELGEITRQYHLDTEKVVLDLTGHKKLGENNAILQRALGVRNPYVDCLNVLQAETLKRIRANPDEKVLEDALLTTITGISNGMGNTG